MKKYVFNSTKFKLLKEISYDKNKFELDIRVEWCYKLTWWEIKRT